MIALIAKRYAKALMMVAVDEIQMVRFEIELDLLATCYLKTSFRAFFENPTFYLSERLDFVKSLRLDSQLTHCLELLIESKRMLILPALSKAYARELDTKLGRIRAKITSANALTPEQIESVTQNLLGRLGKPVLPELFVAPQVLSGIRAQIGGLIFDNTLESQFSQLRRVLCN